MRPGVPGDLHPELRHAQTLAGCVVCKRIVSSFGKRRCSTRGWSNGKAGCGHSSCDGGRGWADAGAAWERAGSDVADGFRLGLQVGVFLTHPACCLSARGGELVLESGGERCYRFISVDHGQHQLVDDLRHLRPIRQARQFPGHGM